ncbi:hypothetical protein CCDG5_1791 [[Clostridium] cellulosi]|jgi:hypothetical protein|uniref:DUF4190 domain-containing protein n=1 Tax=[Clostridium] cellulosi TaxID=29343 RepID=A0A078KUX3_9FIRM|nr:MAG: DUF4190 domain-containing protein [[Clostridium] cellulosi]CDZ24889.1 hypothetical protein CCDG5_1791 [[Clostridium] cellulosi]
MKICPKCGKQCGDNYLFCDSCGCRLDQESAAEQTKNDGSTENSAQSQASFTSPAQNQTTASAAASTPNSNAADFNNASQQQYNPYYGTQSQSQYHSSNPGQFQGNYNTTYSNQTQGQYTNPNPYPQNPWQPNVRVEPKNNPFAIASFVLGIVGVVFMCAYFTGVIPSILAIVFGCVGRSKIKASEGREKGLGFTTAGITLGIVALVLMVLLIILTAIGIITLSAMGSSFDKISDIDDLRIHNLWLIKF